MDLFKRDNSNTVSIQAFAKKNGFSQCITSITRPNSRGGSCIDLIMTNCIFVSATGNSDDMISDHYSVYCVREKKKERKIIVTETVRDYKNFKKENCCQLLSNIDWSMYDVELNPEVYIIRV